MRPWGSVPGPAAAPSTHTHTERHVIKTSHYTSYSDYDYGYDEYQISSRPHDMTFLGLFGVCGKEEEKTLLAHLHVFSLGL